MKRRVIDVSKLSHLAFGPRDPLWWSVASLIAIEGTMLVLLALSYLYVSDRTTPFPPTHIHQFVAILMTVEIVLWIITSISFSWYVSSFGSYNRAYGALGAIIGFMTWIWLSATVILLGAELNAEMEHQTARDSTVGPPKPLGKRGASVADSIGKSAD